MKKQSNQQQMRGDGTPSKKNARQMEKMAEKNLNKCASQVQKATSNHTQTFCTGCVWA
jgi:hypothetical protein